MDRQILCNIIAGRRLDLPQYRTADWFGYSQGVGPCDLLVRPAAWITCFQCSMILLASPTSTSLTVTHWTTSPPRHCPRFCHSPVRPLHHGTRCCTKLQVQSNRYLTPLHASSVERTSTTKSVIFQVRYFPPLLFLSVIFRSCIFRRPKCTILIVCT